MYKLALVVSLIALAGCDGNTGSTQTRISDGWGSADIKLITLNDGTRCATLIGDYKGAISCDWDHKSN